MKSWSVGRSVTDRPTDRPTDQLYLLIVRSVSGHSDRPTDQIFHFAQKIKNCPKIANQQNGHNSQNQIEKETFKRIAQRSPEEC